MSDLYDIFFAGKIVDGFDEATVRENVAKLFKANAQTVEKLFSGKPQAIKRGVDKQAAVKYKAAMQKAGAVPLIRAHAEAQPKAAGDAPPSGGEAKPKQTMAERLAALTGEEVPSETEEAAAPAPAPAPAPTPAPTPTPAPATPPAAEAAAAATASATSGAASFDANMSLAPVGSDVLRDEERDEVEELDIDTSAIHLTPEFAEPEIEETEAPPAPDVSHMSMGEPGDDIPHLEEEKDIVDPDTNHLSMGEPGEEIPHLEEDKEIVDPDTSGIDLAPEGSEVLEEQYRKEEAAQPPNTDHLSLED